MHINFNQGGQPQSLMGKVVAAIIGLLTLAAALMFSLVFVAVIAVVGLVVWGYFWWKTRELRRHLREQMEQMQTPPFNQPTAEPAGDGEIIEGEAVRVVDEKNRISE